jgi:RNA polymerase sigma factor (sigma-70 family)
LEFEQFVRAELVGFSRFAGVLVGDRQLAHDVLADALLAASRRWSQIGVMAAPAAYVRQIIVTTFLAERRKTMRRQTLPSADHTVLDRPSPDATGRIVDRELLDGLLRRLPAQQRTAVVLRYYLDYGDAAIAETMNTSVSNVRSTISRALAGLRVTTDVVQLRKDS